MKRTKLLSMPMLEIIPYLDLLRAIRLRNASVFTFTNSLKFMDVAR